MRRVQEEVGLDPEYFLVALAREQLILTSASEAFVERVRWEDGVAAAWRPAVDARSPVLISPDRPFGKPMVSGISTEVLWEHTNAGEAVETIAEDFDLDIRDVRWALSYENAQRAA